MNACGVLLRMSCTRWRHVTTAASRAATSLLAWLRGLAFPWCAAARPLSCCQPIGRGSSLSPFVLPSSTSTLHPETNHTLHAFHCFCFLSMLSSSRQHATRLRKQPGTHAQNVAHMQKTGSSGFGHLCWWVHHAQHARRYSEVGRSLPLETKACKESVSSRAALSGMLPCRIWLLSSGTATSELSTLRLSRGESPSSPHTTCRRI